MGANSFITNKPAAYDTRLVVISGLILFTLAFLLFGNTMTHGWTMDDFPVVVNNPDIRSLQGFWENRQPGRPLRELSLLFDHFLFGDNPMGYHLQNIFWHGLNAVLILVLCLQLKLSRWSSWAVALLFLCHPVQVEVVANVSHRKDSLMLAFALMATLSYFRFFAANRSRTVWFCSAVAFSFLSFMAKQTAVALPIIFLTYEFCFIPPDKRLMAKRPWLVWCAIALAFAGVCAWIVSVGGYPVARRAMQTTLAFHANYFGGDVLAAWVVMVLQSWGLAFSKLFWPLGLAVEYVVAVPETWLTVKVLGGALLCLGLLCSAGWAYRCRYPRMLFGLVWMMAIYLPVANIIPLSYPVADRYLYAPSVGFFMLLALFVDHNVSSELVKKLGLLLVVLALCVLTFRQNRVWESSLSLYKHASVVNPESVFVLNTLGWELYQSGATDKALNTLQKAVSVNPHHPRAWYNLGLLYERQGNGGKASVCYQNSVKKSNNLPGFEAQAEEIRKHLMTRYGIKTQ